jgi:hypothetical protein
MRLETPFIDAAISIISDSNYIYCVSNKEGIFRYNIAEKTWKFLEKDWNLDKPNFQKIFFGKNNYIYATNNADGLQRSNDLGLNWEDCKFNLETSPVIVFSNITGEIFCREPDGLKKDALYQLITSDSIYWEPIYYSEETNFFTQVVSDYRGNLIIAERIYIPEESRITIQLFKYDIALKLLEPIKDSLPDVDIYHLSIDKNDNIYVNVWYLDSLVMFGFFKSTIGNNQWEEITGNLSEYFSSAGPGLTDLITISNDEIFLLNSRGVLYCNNEDFNFFYENEGMIDPKELKLLYLGNNGHLYTSNKGSIYYTSNPITNVDSQHSDNNVKLIVSPNPIENNLLTVYSSIVPNSYEIFNAIGCSVDKIINNNLNFNYTIDITKLQEGIYFLKVNFNNGYKILKFVKI